MDMFDRVDWDAFAGTGPVAPVEAAPAESVIAAVAPPAAASPFATPSATRTEVAITTALGTFVVELFEDTPISTAKFIDNVVNDRYSGGGTAVQGDAFIHRREADFVLQGGGYYQNGSSTFTPIISQITGELGVHANSIYTLSWALNGTNQGTAGGQWFINLRDNATALSSYPVFGQVVGGLPAFNADATLPTIDLGSPFNQLPVLNGATAQTFTLNDLLRVTYDVLGVARADTGSTGEASVLNGTTVFANDTDLDSALAIALVNGVAASFGSVVTLTSGAKLTVNADGTYSYDPNHVFDALNTGQTATDSFTYTLAGGHLVTGTATVTITINGAGAPAGPPNQAPSGASSTVALTHVAAHVMTVADFGYSDPDGNALQSVTITSAATAGRLLLANGAGVRTDVVAGQVISAADILAGKLVYKLATNGATGSFGFRVQDNGGTANNGVDTDPTTRTLTYTYAPNQAPSGADSTVAVQHGVLHTLSAASFGYSDPDGYAFGSVTINTVPTVGRLLYAATPSGPRVAVTPGQVITADDLANGRLVYKPDPSPNGPATGTLTFQVHDIGGTVNGGADTDASPNTLTFDAGVPNGAATEGFGAVPHEDAAGSLLALQPDHSAGLDLGDVPGGHAGFAALIDAMLASDPSSLAPAHVADDPALLLHGDLHVAKSWMLDHTITM